MLVYVATIEHQRGNLRRAILYYQQALAVSKDKKTNTQMLANMGHAYGDLGDGARALDCYRAAQRMQTPSISRAQNSTQQNQGP